MLALDCQIALQLAPAGTVMFRERVMLDVNDEAARIFGRPRTTMMGQSFEPLYPTHDEYERTGARIIPVMNARGSYSNECIVKRTSGESSWCHVTSRALDRVKPLGKDIWTFEDLSAYRPVIAVPTPRERDTAAQPVEGKTSKQIGKQLEISLRAVEIYRAQPMKKYAANASLELVQRLMGY